MISRAELARLRPSTPVSVKAAELLALMVLADRYRNTPQPDLPRRESGADDASHDADCWCLSATESDSGTYFCVSGRADRLTGATGGFYREGRESQ